MRLAAVASVFDCGAVTDSGTWGSAASGYLYASCFETRGLCTTNGTVGCTAKSISTQHCDCVCTWLLDDTRDNMFSATPSYFILFRLDRWQHTTHNCQTQAAISVSPALRCLPRHLHLQPPQPGSQQHRYSVRELRRASHAPVPLRIHLSFVLLSCMHLTAARESSLPTEADPQSTHRRITTTFTLRTSITKCQKKYYYANHHTDYQKTYQRSLQRNSHPFGLVAITCKQHTVSGTPYSSLSTTCLALRSCIEHASLVGFDPQLVLIQSSNPIAIPIACRLLRWDDHQSLAQFGCLAQR